MLISQDNKRDYFRMLINATCDVTVSDGTRKYEISAICKDMSATGIALATSEKIPVGASVEVLIESQHSHFASLQATTKAVRCKSQDDGDYIIGLQVLSFDS